PCGEGEQVMGSGFGIGIPGFGMILVWGLIIVVVILLVRAIAGGFPSRGKSARQVLDERFARGEIDQREYEERRRLLE
ncbi:MAG: SHOCT domain-containing protein, partial [Chromatiaceae bacterium]